MAPMHRSALALALHSLVACSRKLGPYEQAQEDQRKASCPDLRGAAECAVRLEAQRMTAAQVADAGRLAAEEAATAAQKAELRGLSKDAREARVREACRPDGHCNAFALHQLSRSTDDPAERKAIAAICMKARGGAVAALRGELAILRRLAANAGAKPGDCVDVSEPKARMASFGTDVQPTAVHQLRVAVNQVRMCSCSTASRSSCDDVTATLKDAESDLAEPQNEFCE